MLDYLRLGDTVVVVKLDRLSRSLKDLLDLTARIDASGAQFQSLDESIDTSSPHGKLIFHVFGSLPSSSGIAYVKGHWKGLLQQELEGDQEVGPSLSIAISVLK